MVAEPNTVSQPITYTDLLARNDERRIELYDGEVVISYVLKYQVLHLLL